MSKPTTSENNESKASLFDDTFFDSFGSDQSSNNNAAEETQADRHEASLVDNHTDSNHNPSNTDQSSSITSTDANLDRSEADINSDSSADFNSSLDNKPSLFDGEDEFFKEVKQKEQAVLEEISTEKQTENATNHDEFIESEDIFTDDPHEDLAPLPTDSLDQALTQFETNEQQAFVENTDTEAENTETLVKIDTAESAEEHQVFNANPYAPTGLAQDIALSQLEGDEAINANQDEEAEILAFSSPDLAEETSQAQIENEAIAFDSTTEEPITENDVDLGTLNQASTSSAANLNTETIEEINYNEHASYMPQTKPVYDDSDKELISNLFSDEEHQDSSADETFEEQEEVIADEFKSKAFAYSETIDEPLINTEKKQGLDNRTIFIILFLSILGMIFWGYTSYTSRYTQYGSGRSSRRKPRDRSSTSRNTKKAEIVPVWQTITDFDTKTLNLEGEFVSTSLNRAGRNDPFSMPETVIIALADKDAAIKAGLDASGKPEKISLKAFRASLIGILGTEDSKLAIINLKEASFEILPTVDRSKVIQAATREMRSAKDNTIEVTLNDFIGNWQITEIDRPDGTSMSDPRLVLKRNNETKILSLGKTEELGIYDSNNDFDDLSSFADE